MSSIIAIGKGTIAIALAGIIAVIIGAPAGIKPIIDIGYTAFWAGLLLSILYIVMRFR